jgi:transglutaminase-like putative cysteine protease
VSTSGEVAARAEKAAAGKSGGDEVARALYDRVLSDVNYDKSGTGWGRGDTTYVCEAGKGNCSDFHALFIGMSRSRGVPALFEIGFPLPRDRKEGTVGGYHCWAWYEEKPGLWRPVDASEADKDPSRTDYFFGTLCCNRVALSRGRDVVLAPPQKGAPLNFFIYPYVEVDDAVHDAKKIDKKFAYEDVR